MSDLLALTATCSRGLEELLAVEIASCGGHDIEHQHGAVTFRGDLATAYRLCLWSRLASRLLLTLAHFDAASADELYDGVRALEWKRHLHAANTLAVDCVLNHSAINHSHFAALRVKDAVVDYFRDRQGDRPSVDTRQPDIRLNLYLKDDVAHLALDLSGTSLHRRGYRLETGLAPLKESLAAAIVIRAGVTPHLGPDDVILDPLCGSATLLIEAAQIIGDVAPGLDRRFFGFLKWRGHQKNIWQELVNEALEREEAGQERPWPRLLGFDADPAAITASLANIERAGLSGRIHVERRELAHLQPPAKLNAGFHLIVTNPPYGERLSEKDEVKYLYRCLGHLAAEHFPGWRLAVFTGNPDLLQGLGQRSLDQYRLFNGPIHCTLRLHAVEPAPAPTSPWQINTKQPPSPLANRLKKNLKPLLKWATKENINCLRVYDRDIPEYNVAIDLYGPWIQIQEYAAPSSVSQDAARARRREIIDTVSGLLDCKKNRIFVKTRERQKGSKQYDKKGSRGRLVAVEEGGCRFLVNLSDYLDTGLFVDHRPLRLHIQELAAGKRFLNLYCYTGSATVHAARGGARSTTSVDMSATYLTWARKNLLLNGFDPQFHRLERGDCLQWLKEQTVERYDLIFVDPPTFSATKRGGRRTFDVQRDHQQLIELAMALLEKDGLLLFSTNFRKFRLADSLQDNFVVRDISSQTIGRDFGRNKKIHRAFVFRHPA